jgi:hypothetical protein
LDEVNRVRWICAGCVGKWEWARLGRANACLACAVVVVDGGEGDCGGVGVGLLGLMMLVRA